MSCSELLREFALEPSLLNNWADFRFYFDNFGIHRGRLISRFPRRWKRMVYDSLPNNIGDVERKRIEDRLSIIDEKMIKMNRDYDSNQSWLENAERSHTEVPFHAILAAENPNNNDFVLISSEVDERNELWRCDTGLSVPRTPEALSDVIRKLFQISREILFVDPHFGPEVRRYRATLKHFLECAFQTGNHFARIEFHFSEKSTFDFFDNECSKQLPQLIPIGLAVTFKRWRQITGRERLHARYILTEKGGLLFEGGLDAGRTGETVDVSILQTSLYQERWANYQTDTTVFDFVDEVTITGTREI